MDINYVFKFWLFVTGVIASCVFGKCVTSPVAQRRASLPAILEREVEEGKTVTLECSSPGKTSINRQWIKNNLHLRSDAHGSLIIKDVRGNDSGLYQCTSNKQTVLIRYRLKVIKKPVLRIDVKGEDLVRLDKDTKGYIVSLVCTVLSYPYPTAVWWQFGDTKLVYYNRSNGSVNGTGCESYEKNDPVDSNYKYYNYQEKDTNYIVDSNYENYNYQEKDTNTGDQVSYYIADDAFKCFNQTLKLTVFMKLDSDVVFGEYTCRILYDNIEMSKSYNLQKQTLS